MTDPFAAMVAERYPALAKTYAVQLRLPIYPIAHLAGHEPASEPKSREEAQVG